MEPIATDIKIKTAIGVVETTRKLARIVKIDKVIKHPNADALSLVSIGGWQCVTRLDEYKEGDVAVYCEIDSLLPIDNEVFAFLASRTSDNRMVEGKVYHKLKSIKLRKELSQGLLVPVPPEYKHLPAETNLTEQLGVLKYEAVSNGKITQVLDRDSQGDDFLSKLIRKLVSGVPGAMSPWPSFLIKSDQDRIQNKVIAFEEAKIKQTVFEVTYKLDGSSMTVYNVDGRCGVCSRNFELALGRLEVSLKEKIKYWLGTLLMKNRKFFKNWTFRKPVWLPEVQGSENNFTSYVIKHNVIDKLKAYQAKTGRFMTVQGELIGPSIQGNFEGVEDFEFHVFTIYENGCQELLPEEAQVVAEEIGVTYVPIFDNNFVITPEQSIKDILEMAEGQRAFNPQKNTYREGLVFKAKDSILSFKAISNSYLLKAKD